jgi:hypothetical protein
MPSSMTAVCAAANESSTIAAIKKGKASKRRCGGTRLLRGRAAPAPAVAASRDDLRLNLLAV